MKSDKYKRWRAQLASWRLNRDTLMLSFAAVVTAASFTRSGRVRGLTLAKWRRAGLKQLGVTVTVRDNASGIFLDSAVEGFRRLVSALIDGVPGLWQCDMPRWTRRLISDINAHGVSVSIRDIGVLTDLL